MPPLLMLVVFLNCAACHGGLLGRPIANRPLCYCHPKVTRLGVTLRNEESCDGYAEGAPTYNEDHESGRQEQNSHYCCYCEK